MPLHRYAYLTYINCRINIEGEIYGFNENIVCYSCNLQNSLFHMLRECKVFQEKRNDSSLPMEDDCVDLYRIFEAPDLKTLRKFYAYLKHILYRFDAVIIHQQT